MIAPPSFIGRHAELARIHVALDDVFAGHGRLLALVGEPGIGKTRTAEEVADLARTRGAFVVTAHCHDGGGTPAVWPWRQIVRGLAREVDDATLADELGSGAADLAHVVDDLRRRLPTLAALPDSLEPDEARFRLFDAFAQFLRNAARRRPLVLVLDDLHWADPPSLRLLQFLAREMADSSLLIVATYREVDVLRDETRAEALGALSRERLYERLPLLGLNQDEAAALLAADLGTTPSTNLARTLCERTEGNPFFLKELARHFVEQGLDPATHDIETTTTATLVPVSVRAVITQRLRRLAEATRELLTAAAVLGREFDLSALALLADIDLAHVLKYLDEAALAGLVQPLAPGTTRARFAHALVSDVIYQALPADQRAATHHRAGSALERRWQLDLDDHAGELAHHFWIAAADGAATLAVEYSRRAGERATADFAYEEAIRFYQQALDALALDPLDQRESRCRLLLGLGSAQAAVSDLQHLRETFRRAAELARQLSDPNLLGQAAVGFARVPSIGGTVDQVAVDLLEEALASLPPDDSTLRAGLLSILADGLHHAPGMHDRRVALCHEASAMARRLGDARTLARTLYDQHTAIFSPDTLDLRFATANELLQLAEQTNDRPMLVRARFCRAIDLFELGDVPAAVAETDALARLADELREPWHHWYAAWLRATHALMLGRFADGETFAYEAYAHGERVTRDHALQVLGVQLTMLRALQGRCGEMVGAIRDMLSQFPAMSAWRCALAYHCSESGLPDEARRHFDVLAADDFQSIPRDGSWLVSVSQLADVCVDLGDAQRAPVLYALLLPFADHMMSVDRALACSGFGDRYLGVLATTMGHWEVAERHLAQALARHRQLGLRPWVAFSQLDCARLYAARDSSLAAPAAQAALSEAIALASELGMEGLLGKATHLQHELAAPGLSAAAGAPAQPQSPLPTGDPATGGMECACVKEGEFWTVQFAGHTCRLKDSLGLAYLVQLLRHPGRPFHVTELQSLAAGALPERTRDEEAAPSIANDRLPALDERARRAYRQRLVELQEELEEARDFNDLGAVDRVQNEMDLLAREISGAARPSTAGERSRVSVTKRLKAALAKIRSAHPALGDHLDKTVKSGFFCSYTPDGRLPIDWRT